MGLKTLAAALLLLAAGPPRDEVTGRYRLTGEPDVVSELALSADGRFAYGLAAGALDEQAEGRWRREGNSLFLTTEPVPVPPVFSAGEAAKSEAAGFTLRVIWPGGDGIAGIDLRVGFAQGGTVEGYTQEDGWSLPEEERRTPAWVELSVPMHGLASPRFAVDPAAANALTFVLTPNDLGIVDFRDLRLDVEPGRLVMHRGEARLVYARAAD